MTPGNRTRAEHTATSSERGSMHSRVLVWALTPVLAAECLSLWTIHSGVSRDVRVLLFTSLAVSAVSAVAVWKLRAGTPAAALIGGLISWRLTFLTGQIPRDPPRGPSALHSLLLPLFLLFLVTFAATRLAKHRIQRNQSLQEEHHGRSASQVLANLGFAGITCSWFLLQMLGPQTFTPVLLAALCEATADTVSSELGQAFGGRPFMITTLRRTDPGEDGAISLLGTLAGIAASLAVAAACIPAIHLRASGYAIAAAGGIAGLFFDSLLGATVERRGWVGNDLVNFSSTVFAGLCALVILILMR